MIDITLPKVEQVMAAENYGRFKIEPLEPGYGITIGNALRRILLSSLPGAAVTSIKIDGVYHEFSSVPGVQEDVTEIVLNVKRVRLRSYAERPVKLLLQGRGEGVIFARDIVDIPSTIELITPDQPLVTLGSTDAKIDMELTVERGRGYVPADARENLPIGVVPVDAIFTPIPKVNFVVEKTRIGQLTTYDRLILEIWTDGTILPAEALSYAAKVMVQHNQLIADFNRGEAVIEEASKLPISTAPISPQLYDTPIEDLDLSVRTYNCLKRSNITKVGQILAMDENELLGVRNFGRKSFDELRARLIARGFITSSSPLATSSGGFLEDDEDVVGNDVDSAGEDSDAAINEE